MCGHVETLDPPPLPLGGVMSRKRDHPAHRQEWATQAAHARPMKADGHTGTDIAKYLGVNRATLYRYLNEESAA